MIAVDENEKSVEEENNARKVVAAMTTLEKLTNRKFFQVNIWYGEVVKIKDHESNDN